MGPVIGHHYKIFQIRNGRDPKLTQCQLGAPVGPKIVQLGPKLGQVWAPFNPSQFCGLNATAAAYNAEASLGPNFGAKCRLKLDMPKLGPSRLPFGPT